MEGGADLNRNYGLDAIRVAAAALVFGFHAGRMTGVQFAVTDNGYVAVGAFFVLSGYLVYRPFVWGEPEPRSYAIRRMARVLPALLVAIAGYVLIPRAYQGLIVTWSLVVEIVFYLTLPLLAAFIARRLERLVLLAAISAAIDVVAVAAGKWPAFPSAYIAPALFWTFALGMGVALLERQAPARLLSRATAAAPVLLAVGVITGGVPSSIARGVWLDPFTPLASALVVAALVARPIRLPSAIGFAADVSYPFYLWHVAALAALGAFWAGPLLAVAGLAAAIAVSVLSVILVERPARNWATRRLVTAGNRQVEATRDSTPRRSPSRADSRVRGDLRWPSWRGRRLAASSSHPIPVVLKSERPRGVVTDRRARLGGWTGRYRRRER